MRDAQVMEIEALERELVESPVPMVVWFYTRACEFCRSSLTVLEDARTRLADAVQFRPVNVDQEVGLADRFGVATMPTLLVFKNGLLIDYLVGPVNPTVLAERLEGVAADARTLRSRARCN